MVFPFRTWYPNPGASPQEITELEGQLKFSLPEDYKAFLKRGNFGAGLGASHVFGDVYEMRGYHGGRVYFRNVNGVIEILAKSTKNNQKAVIKRLRELYGK